MKKIENLKRLNKIIKVLSKYGYHQILDSLGIKNYFFKKEKNETLSHAVKIRKILEELGPTFIKFGQTISARPDIVPETILNELKKLQDQVPEDSFENIISIIEESFKKPHSKIFKRINKKPIGSASIAQVHKAYLKTGEEVVIKIQRKNLKKQIENDLDLIEYLAHLIEKHIEEFREYEPINLVQEIRKSIRRELDFEKEAQNIQTFHKYFKSDKNIVFPEVFPKFSSKNILTMSYEKGIKADNLEKLTTEYCDRKIIAQNGANAIFKQIFEYGFFHADPHAGNILILPENKIAFLDCGMVGYLDDSAKSFLAQMLVSIMEKDEQKIVNTLLDENLIPNDISIKNLKNDFHEFLINYYDLPLEKIKMQELFFKFNKLIRTYKIKLPSHFIFVCKSLVMIEGIGRGLDPKYNPLKEIKPFVKKLIMSQYDLKNISKNIKNLFQNNAQFIKNFPQDFKTFLRKTQRDGLKINIEHADLKNLNKTLNQVGNRFAFSLVLASLLISSSLIIQSNIPPYLFNMPILGVIGFIFSGITGLFLMISILRKR